MSATRTETDGLGSVEIPADRLWGPQTERARQLFRIGTERFPPVLIRAVGLQKQAAAEANRGLGELPADIAEAIAGAAAAIASGAHDDEFPLTIWQTGSGTQTNMNANEVIANLVNPTLGGALGSRGPVHPNDHVNRGQSSNDMFPTVMHIAVAEAVTRRTIPALDQLRAALERRALEWGEVVKVGRTHMMDAVPVTLGQEFRSWARQAELGMDRLRGALPRLMSLAQGGTAAGSGLNCHPGFPAAFAARLGALTGLPFAASDLPAEGMGAHDALVEMQGALNTVAVSLFKVASDIRLLGSGPRAGLGELVIPADGLSSSIMPGKTNPTQSEALTMVCTQVMGNTTTVTMAGAQGHLELNVFKPVILQAVLQSALLLADAAESFATNMVERLAIDAARIADHLSRSLMLVTALNPHIGYDRAVAVGRKALAENMTLREAAHRLGYVSPEDFDRWVVPADMIRPATSSDHAEDVQVGRRGNG